MIEAPLLAPTRIVPWRRVAIGTAFALSSIVTYPVALSLVQLRSANSVFMMEGVGYLTLTTLFLGLMLVLSGVSRLLTRPIMTPARKSILSSLVSPLTFVLRDRLSARVRLVTAFGYAIFFAFFSGILVYQPDLNFSTLYGVDVPSSVVVTCCGSAGQIPQLVVYLTGHLGLLLSPLTLTLLVTVSWLVGINLAVLANAFTTRNTKGREGLVSGMGAMLGVLTACPACTGAFLTTIIGGSGVVLVAALSTYQAYFIVASIPLLIIAPIWTARRVSASLATSCVPPC